MATTDLTFEKGLPANIDAERFVLGSVLATPLILPIVLPISCGIVMLLATILRP